MGFEQFRRLCVQNPLDATVPYSVVLPSPDFGPFLENEAGILWNRVGFTPIPG